MRRFTLALAAACAACSLLVDTGDLQSGDGPSSDGGTDSSSNVRADATVDGTDGASKTDSGTPIDGGDAGTDANAPAEAGVDSGVDASGLGFCASHPGALFCDDFDQPGRTDLRTEGWTPFYDYPLGALVTTQFFSAPRSVRFVQDWPDAGGPSRMVAIRSFGVSAATTGIVASGRVRPELSSPSYMGWLEAELRGCDVYLTFQEANLYWNGSTYWLGNISTAFEKWTAAAITIKARPNGCDVSVTVGEGDSAVTESTSATEVPATAPPSNAIISIGHSGSDSVGAVEVDDILVVPAP